MRARKNAIAVAQLLLLFPAALFMTSLIVRRLQPLQYDPAHTAQQIVSWYSGRLWTLWVLLIALPFAALVTGGGTLFHGWNSDAQLPPAKWQTVSGIRVPLATLLVAGATLTAGGILAIVILHMLAN